MSKCHRLHSAIWIALIHMYTGINLEILGQVQRCRHMSLTYFSRSQRQTEKHFLYPLYPQCRIHSIVKHEEADIHRDDLYIWMFSVNGVGITALKSYQFHDLRTGTNHLGRGPWCSGSSCVIGKSEITGSPLDRFFFGPCSWATLYFP